MSTIRAFALALVLAPLAGCGTPITGDWTGKTELEGVAQGSTYGLTVEKDARFQVSGDLVDAASPDVRHAVTGGRVGNFVFLAWQTREGDVVEVIRVVGQAEGNTIEGVFACERQVNGEADGYCPELPVGTASFERGTLVIEPADTAAGEPDAQTGG